MSSARKTIHGINRVASQSINPVSLRWAVNFKKVQCLKGELKLLATKTQWSKEPPSLDKNTTEKNTTEYEKSLSNEFDRLEDALYWAEIALNADGHSGGSWYWTIHQSHKIDEIGWEKWLESDEAKHGYLGCGSKTNKKC